MKLFEPTYVLSEGSCIILSEPFNIFTSFQNFVLTFFLSLWLFYQTCVHTMDLYYIVGILKILKIILKL